MLSKMLKEVDIIINEEENIASVTNDSISDET